MELSCRCISVMAMAAGSVLSLQSFAQEVERPQYYSFEQNPVINANYSHDPRFAAAVRVQLGNDTGQFFPYTAQDAAARAVQYIHERLVGWGTLEQTLDQEKICITIQNFGGSDRTWKDNVVSFKRSNDSVVVNPSDFETNGQAVEWSLCQPWMTQAVGIYNPSTQSWEGGDATLWMEEFCVALDTQLQNPLFPELNDLIPARFHFDMEATVAGTDSGGNAIIRTMLACEADTDRWGNPNDPDNTGVPVPGFGGKSMVKIWQDAQDAYGWRTAGYSGDYRLLSECVNAEIDGDTGTNRPFVVWWVDVCRKAMVAAFKISCYDVIKEHYGSNGPLVSNYEDFVADLDLDTFGFRATNPNLSPSSLSNEFYRGDFEFNNRGAFPTLVRSGGPFPLMYAIYPNYNENDFDSPVLYFYGEPHSALFQRRWYEPPNTSGEFVLETPQQVYHRYHRHLLETALNSSGTAPYGVAPWIPLPHLMSADGTTTTGIDDCRRTLALLRSKDIREINLFGDKHPNGRGDAVDWNDLKRADAQVYTPQLKSAELIRGTGGGWSEQTLNTTLRSDDPVGVEILSEMIPFPDCDDVTEFVVRFTHVKPQDLGANGRLVLECRVDPVDSLGYPGWREEIKGQVSIWNVVLGQWDPLPTVHDHEPGEYGFYVDESGSVGSTSTRREWDLGYEGWDGLCAYLDDQEECANGTIAFKFTHTAPGLISGFTSTYDLVMFYHLDDFTPIGGEDPFSLRAGSSSSSSGGFLPADFNFDGLQDSADADLFTTAWTNGERRADYNADGEIDALDLTQFLGALSRATSAGGSSEW